VASRLSMILLLCGAGACAALLAYPFWNLRVTLAVASAALAGAALSLLFFGRGRSADHSPSAETSQTIEYKDQVEPVEKAAQANALLEATMNGMREGMLVVDEEMRVIASNQAARDIFTHVEGSLESRRLSELSRNPAIHAAFIAALQRNERAEAKVEMLNTDRLTYDLRVVPLRLDDREKTRGAIGVFFDITRLERLERVRQEFLSNVSHELRTPLTAILAFVETLEDGAINDSENNERFLSVIRKNAERMRNLIDDILELSAIEAGNIPVEVTQVRLHSVVRDVVTALGSRADARRIRLFNEVDAEAIVFADARRVEQMVTNLVDNGIKFNHEGGSVIISHEKGENGRDRITVKDTGDGIPPEHIKRIFERFYRIDRARSREMGGTGLGLAIVKHLARAHGGEVSVQSAPGQGSTFIIELPASPSKQPGRQPSVEVAVNQHPDELVKQAP
jgi:two-component system, OmpR family, phosphate regulon sensor histidine kinase PhoR